MNLRDLYMAGCSARRALGLAAARQSSSADCPREAAQQGACACKAATVQTLAFRAATGKAFTTFFAGLALTMTTLPKTSLLPAFVAMSPSDPMSFAHTDFLSSHSVASASASAPLVMAFAVDFMGAISCAEARNNEGWTV